MALLTKKLQGATLLESIVAMVLLMVCLGIATLVYVNVVGSGNSRQKFHAYVLIHQVAAQARIQRNYLDEEQEMAGITVTKKISKYAGMEKTYTMKITATDLNGEVLAEQKEIIWQ